MLFVFAYMTSNSELDMQPVGDKTDKTHTLVAISGHSGVVSTTILWPEAVNGCTETLFASTGSRCKRDDKLSDFRRLDRVAAQRRAKQMERGVYKHGTH